MKTNTEQPNVTKSQNLAEVQLTYSTNVKPSQRTQVKTSLDTYNILKEVWSNDIEHRESFIIIMLNRANKVLGWAKISTGGVSGTVCDPKIIFQFALNANATAIILSHNHPSGNFQPSQEDKRLTETIKQGGQILDITLIDHVIMTSEAYYSFSDEGIL